MKKEHINKIAAIVISGAAFLALSAPAFAQVSTNLDLGVSAGGATAGASASANASTRQATLTSRTTTEIANRIATLNQLLTRLNGMKHVSDSEKTTLTATINSTISSLTTLKTKIGSDTTTAELKADQQSITQGTRVYALVEPELRIAAAADSAQTVADTISATAAKTQTRLTAAESQGADVADLLTLQTEVTAKVADANTQSQAALTLLVNLAPDNGSATVEASNNAALKSARADVATATNDLKTAQRDIRSIISGITKSEKTSASASSSASASASTPAPTTSGQ